MSKSKTLARTAATRAFPVLTAVQLAKQTKQHWDDNLSARQRKRLVALLRTSHGNPARLTSRQRREVVDIVKDFEPIGLGRQLALTAAGVRRGRKPRATVR